MSSPLVNLSDELRLAIIEILQPDNKNDLLNLSSTCRSYRSLLAPNIFKTVILRNDEKSGKALKEFLQSENHVYVKELHYKGKTLLPPDHVMQDADLEGDDEQDNPEAVFSEATREVLNDLKEFPNLERLIVKFDWDEGELNNGFYHFDEEETVEEIEVRERDNAWRALMTKTYAAIGTNRDTSNVKYLEMKDLLAKSMSSWWSDDFKAFLGSLEEFKLSILGMENGAGWCVNTNDGYLAFLSEIGEDLTDHLYSVERLTIAANDAGPIGCEGFRHATTSLAVGSIPKLKHLDLKFFFMDPPLIRFIESHLDSLESIILEDCYAADENGLAENGYPWKQFFDRIAARNPAKLKKFTITPETVSMPWDGVFKEQWNYDRDEVKNAKALLESGRRAFAYGYLDDKYGMLFDDDEASIEKLLDGSDYEAYRKLMEIVQNNAEIAA